MFTEWHGEMNWPLDPDWECEICGNKPLLLPGIQMYLTTGLVWGLVHGVCRCTKCHAQYDMRDRDDKHVTTPRSRLKPKYKEAAKLGWEPLGLPLDEWTDHMWTVALQWAEEAEKGEDYGQPRVPVSV